MTTGDQERENSPLQRAVARALERAPKSRDHYDKLIQELLGTKGKPIYDIQRGKSKNPSVATLEAVATVLKIPLSELTGPRREARIQSDMPPTRSIYDDVGPAKIRQFDLSFAMGPGNNIDDYVEEGILDFDITLLRSITRSPEERLFVARGDGDSMFPTLQGEDMILVDTMQRTLNMQDRIWAVSIYGAGAVKRLRAKGAGKIEVISDNKTIDPQIVDVEDLAILGRVIWFGRRL